MKETQRLGEYSAVIEKDDSEPDEPYSISIFFPGGLTPFEVFYTFQIETAQSVLAAYIQVNLTQREDGWMETATERMNSGDLESATILRDYMASRAVLAMSQRDEDPLQSLENYLVTTMSTVAATMINLKIELIEQGLIPGNSRIMEKLTTVELAANQIEDAFDLIEDLRGGDDATVLH